MTTATANRKNAKTTNAKTYNRRGARVCINDRHDAEFNARLTAADVRPSAGHIAFATNGYDAEFVYALDGATHTVVKRDLASKRDDQMIGTGINQLRQICKRLAGKTPSAIGIRVSADDAPKTPAAPIAGGSIDAVIADLESRAATVAAATPTVTKTKTAPKKSAAKKATAPKKKKTPAKKTTPVPKKKTPAKKTTAAAQKTPPPAPKKKTAAKTGTKRRGDKITDAALAKHIKRYVGKTTVQPAMDALRESGSACGWERFCAAWFAGGGKIGNRSK